MGAIGNIIDKAVDAAVGSSHGTSLQDFLSNFSSSDGTLIKEIDPYSSFDLTMKLYPTEAAKKKKKDSSWAQRLGDSLLTSAKGAVKNAVNNATGGLIGAIMNSNVNVMKSHDGFDKVQQCTFLEYLASANLLVGQEDWIGEKAGQIVRPLELQLGLYCQEATIPNIEVPSGGASTMNQFGEFPITGMFVKPDSQVLTLKFINTRVPLHERIFYPWLRETHLPFWSYDSQPYTTATITIDFTKHNDVQYVFCGCRPQKITMQQATQDKSSPNLKRDVSFLFDYMFINSSLTVAESVYSKILSTGTKLVNSAAKMVKG